jgi:hypothetical protein
VCYQRQGRTIRRTGRVTLRTGRVMARAVRRTGRNTGRGRQRTSSTSDWCFSSGSGVTASARFEISPAPKSTATATNPVVSLRIVPLPETASCTKPKPRKERSTEGLDKRRRPTFALFGLPLAGIVLSSPCAVSVIKEEAWSCARLLVMLWTAPLQVQRCSSQELTLIRLQVSGFGTKRKCRLAHR